MRNEWRVAVGSRCGSSDLRERGVTERGFSNARVGNDALAAWAAGYRESVGADYGLAGFG
jgi:hypothetical protein